jgi:hypothetical protein
LVINSKTSERCIREKVVDDHKIDIPELMGYHELFQVFMEESIEPIWCFELDKPLPIDLPENEQFDLFYSHAYLKENNKAYAQGLGTKGGKTCWECASVK